MPCARRVLNAYRVCALEFTVCTCSTTDRWLVKVIPSILITETRATFGIGCGRCTVVLRLLSMKTISAYLVAEISSKISAKPQSCCWAIGGTTVWWNEWKIQHSEKNSDNLVKVLIICVFDRRRRTILRAATFCCQTARPWPTSVVVFLQRVRTVPVCGCITKRRNAYSSQVCCK